MVVHVRKCWASGARYQPRQAFWNVYRGSGLWSIRLAGMASKLEMRQCEPQRGRAPWLSAAQQETGSRYCIAGWGRGARRQPGPMCRGTGSEESELWSHRWSQVLMLPALQGPACPLCPPSEWRQLLPLAQALRARRALPPGERQGDLVPKRETDRRERGE